MIPRGQEIARQLSEHTQLLSSGDVPQQRGEDVLGAVLRLHEINYNQWRLETTVRTGQRTSDEIAELKRAIDVSNVRRHTAIERIDESLLPSLPPEAVAEPVETSVLNSESLGQMIDRLSILTLRIHFSGQGSENPDEESARSGTLRAQVRYLVRCFDSFGAALSEGRAVMIPSPQFKQDPG